MVASVILSKYHRLVEIYLGLRQPWALMPLYPVFQLWLTVPLGNAALGVCGLSQTCLDVSMAMIVAQVHVL